MKQESGYCSAHQLFVSAASLWEVVIKIDIGKLDVVGSYSQFHDFAVGNGIKILAVKEKHVERLLGLPLLHRDPFDRLLIATAKAEDMIIVTADENIHKYDVAWIW